MKVLVTPIASWPDSSIAGHFLYFQHHFPQLGIWKKIKREPITPTSVDELINRHWTVEFDENLPFAGYCHYLERKIGIRSSQPNYDRDASLCHELVHAIYNSRKLYVGADQQWPQIVIKEVVAEYLGRELRRDVQFLPHIIHAFGLEPGIYDPYSAKAFGVEWEGSL